MVCGSTNGEAVTWLDLTDTISRIEGLYAAPADREVFDLDGIRIIPSTAERELLNTENDPFFGRYLGSGPKKPKTENFDPWRREQEKTTVIGTPPAPLHEQCNIQPTSKRFSYAVDVPNGSIYKSDAEDGALPQLGNAAAWGRPWRVPMQKLTGLTVWSGTYLHGFQFHAGSGTSSPFWGKCGGRPSARWNVSSSHDQEPESCVSEPFLPGRTLFCCCCEYHHAHAIDLSILSISQELTFRGRRGGFLEKPCSCRLFYRFARLALV